MSSLNEREYRQGVAAGAERQITNVAQKHQNRMGENAFSSPLEEWGAHIEGACAELLVAKRLDLHFMGCLPNVDGGNDVGPYGVRFASRPDGELILRRHDRPGQIFILVAGAAPFGNIKGWIKGADGKREEWFRNRGVWDKKPKAFFVPQSALNPDIEILKDPERLRRFLDGPK